jgi:hypothetical protein
MRDHAAHEIDIGIAGEGDVHAFVHLLIDGTECGARRTGVAFGLRGGIMPAGLSALHRSVLHAGTMLHLGVVLHYALTHLLMHSRIHAHSRHAHAWHLAVLHAVIHLREGNRAAERKRSGHKADSEFQSH